MRWFPKVLVRWQEPRWFREKPTRGARALTRRERLFVAALVWVLLFPACSRRLWEGAWLPVLLWGVICFLIGLAAVRALSWLNRNLSVSVILWETHIARSKRQIKLSALAGFSWVQDAEGPVLLAFPRTSEALVSGVPDTTAAARIDAALERLGVPRIPWNLGWEEALRPTLPRRLDRALRAWAVAMLIALLVLGVTVVRLVQITEAWSGRESALVEDLSVAVRWQGHGSANARAEAAARVSELRAELARSKASFKQQVRPLGVVLLAGMLIGGLVLIWPALLRPEPPHWRQRLDSESTTQSSPNS